MTAVIELDDYRAIWLFVVARCRTCRSEYTSFVHRDAPLDALECPKCHLMTAAVVRVLREGERLRSVRDG